MWKASVQKVQKSLIEIKIQVDACVGSAPDTHAEMDALPSLHLSTMSTRVCICLQVSACVNKSVHVFTRVYKCLQVSTRVYKCLQESAIVYKCSTSIK